MVCRDVRGLRGRDRSKAIGVLNVVGADIGALAERPARPVDYDDETAASAPSARRQRWTPLTLEIAA